MNRIIGIQARHDSKDRHKGSKRIFTWLPHVESARKKCRTCESQNGVESPNRGGKGAGMGTGNMPELEFGRAW